MSKEKFNITKVNFSHRQRKFEPSDFPESDSLIFIDPASIKQVRQKTPAVKRLGKDNSIHLTIVTDSYFGKLTGVAMGHSNKFTAELSLQGYCGWTKKINSIYDAQVEADRLYKDISKGVLIVLRKDEYVEEVVEL